MCWPSVGVALLLRAAEHRRAPAVAWRARDPLRWCQRSEMVAGQSSRKVSGTGDCLPTGLICIIVGHRVPLTAMALCASRDHRIRRHEPNTTSSRSLRLMATASRSFGSKGRPQLADQASGRQAKSAPRSSRFLFYFLLFLFRSLSTTDLSPI